MILSQKQYIITNTKKVWKTKKSLIPFKTQDAISINKKKHQVSYHNIKHVHENLDKTYKTIAGVYYKCLINTEKSMFMINHGFTYYNVDRPLGLRVTPFQL